MTAVMVRYDRGHFFYLKCGCMMMSVNQRDGSVIDKKESLFPQGGEAVRPKDD